MSVWGEFRSPLEVEAAIREALQTWIDSALTEIERRTPEFDVREIPRPRAWHAVDSIEDVNDWPDRDLPAVVIEPSDDDKQLANQGRVDKQMAFTLTVMHRGRGKHAAGQRERDRAITVHLAMAVEMVLWKTGDLGGLATGVLVGRTVYDFAPPARPRTLSGAQIDVLYQIPGAMSRWGLPPAPDLPAPTDPPAESPVHPARTATNVRVDVVGHRDLP